MKILKVHDAFVFFIEETFVIFYWIGLWSLLHLTDLPKQMWFCFLCLAFAAFGMFFVRVARPQVVVSIPTSRREFLTSLNRNPVNLRVLKREKNGQECRIQPSKSKNDINIK